MSVLEQIHILKSNVAREIIGQQEMLDSMIVGILSNGNVLVESLPGLAKTRTIKALSRNIESTFARIQFTPDLVSTDITGRMVLMENELTGESEVKFQQGAIFNNIVLADEINRAPPKTQNALLEAMEERQVTAGGKSHPVPDLFMVMATMNPSTQEGTFPMPEAQMDRFLMHISVDYPDEESEEKIIQLVRDEVSQENKKSDIHAEKRTITTQETIFAARAEIDKITVPKDVEQYLVQLIFATRYPERYTYELKSFIKCGASPRASLALDRCARTYAWLNERTEVSYDDIRRMLKPTLRHRLIRGHRAVDHKITTDDICEEVIELVDWKRSKKGGMPPE